MNLTTKTTIIVLAGVAIAVLASSLFVYGILARNQNPYGYGQSPSFGPGSGMWSMMGGQFNDPTYNQPYANQGTTTPGCTGGMGGMGGMGNMMGGSPDMHQNCNQEMSGYSYDNDHEDCPVHGQNEIHLSHNSFMPGTLVVSKGTTVTWTNLDTVTHTVESGTHDEPFDLFDSGSLNPGASFSYTFDKEGAFEYHCDPHPYMIGIVVVQD